MVAGARDLSLRAEALAGVVAPALFAVVVTFLTFAEYDFATALGWHPVRRTGAGWPSVLALAELGWLLVGTLAACGVLGVVFARALYRSSARTIPAAVASVVLAILAVAVGLEAFKTDPPGTGPGTWHGEIHDRVYPLVVLSALAAPVAVAGAVWHDARWKGYGPLSLAVAAVMLAALALQTQQSYAQVVEYVFFGALVVWLELLALRVVALTATDRRGE